MNILKFKQGGYFSSKAALVPGYFICLFLFMISAGCNQHEYAESTSNGESRFEAVEEVNFEGKKAMIYVDNVTSIKYLYIWDGGSNGGPAITRLWDK